MVVVILMRSWCGLVPCRVSYVAGESCRRLTSVVRTNSDESQQVKEYRERARSKNQSSPIICHHNIVLVITRSTRAPSCSLHVIDNNNIATRNNCSTGGDYWWEPRKSRTISSAPGRSGISNCSNNITNIIITAIYICVYNWRERKKLCENCDQVYMCVFVAAAAAAEKVWCQLVFLFRIS